MAASMILRTLKQDKTSGEPGVCARCALVSDTCCRLSPGQEEFCFPLSGEESALIAAADVGVGGVVQERNTEAFVENLCRLFPGERDRVHALFPEGGEHVRLGLDGKGGCSFLGPQGCALPREARPFYCRLFPFWVRTGRIMVFEFKDCLAQRESLGSGDLFRPLGLDRQTARDLYARLRRAWGFATQDG